MDEQGVPVRIGDKERQAAVDALSVHREEGRLDPIEFEERQVTASRARTWTEIGPLFGDLPKPHPVGMPPDLAVPDRGALVVPPAAGKDHGMTGMAAPVERYGSEPAPVGLLGARLPARARESVMALTPFAALLLFFGTGTWIWFLMIPIVAILLFGPDGDRKRQDKKQRDGDKRRR